MDFLQGKVSWFNRYVGLSAVALLHTLLIYIAITSSAHQAPDILNGPLEIKMVKEKIVHPPDVAPPLAMPKKMTMPLPFVPLPEIQVQQATIQNTITVVSRDVPMPTSPSPQLSVDAPPFAGSSADVKAQTDLQSCKPPYPATSMVFEEQGVVRIRFVVGADSQLKDVMVLKSSGHKRLDKATVWGLSRCTFKAALHNGIPVESAVVTDYVWKIDDYDD